MGRKGEEELCGNNKVNKKNVLTRRPHRRQCLPVTRANVHPQPDLSQVLTNSRLWCHCVVSAAAVSAVVGVTISSRVTIRRSFRCIGVTDGNLDVRFIDDVVVW